MKIFKRNTNGHVYILSKYDTFEQMENEEIEEEKIDFNIEVLLPEEPTLQEILNVSTRNSWRPDISDLPDAVVNGEFMVPVGGKLLIEYTDQPARDTVCWIVLAIFPHFQEELTVDPGHVRLYAHSKMYHGCTNYKTAALQGLLLKIPDKKRKWIPGEEETLMERKGKRRRRFVQEEEIEKSNNLLIEGKPVKKKRGRPKGSKSKSTLEREAKERVIQTIPESPKKVNAA